MDSILENDKAYELLTKIHGSQRDNFIKGNLIVKEFMRKKNIILTGGTAIDIVMREAGDKIYPDEFLDFADLDMLSAEANKDSYELVDILYNNGYPSPRSIVAIHPTTMKVDIGEINWIADITYMDKNMLSKVPFILSDGIKVISPDYQRIDLHRAPAFPYAGAPLEAILNRASKDLKRINMLEKYYPFKASKYTTMLETNVKTKSNLELAKSCEVITGLYAFLLLKEHLISSSKDLPSKFLDTFRLNSSNELTLPDGISPRLDVCSLKTAICKNDIIKESYHAYGELIPERSELENKRIYYHEGSMAINTTPNKYRIANIQYVMYESLARAFMMDDVDGFILYEKCIELLHLVETNATGDKSIFYYSLDVYGENVSGVYEIQKNRLDNALYKTPAISKPLNYNKISRDGKLMTTWPKNCECEFPFYQHNGKEKS